jgi:hypothetical protein
MPLSLMLAVIAKANASPAAAILAVGRPVLPGRGVPGAEQGVLHGRNLAGTKGLDITCFSLVEDV